jgi:hypothetical protein
MHRRSQSKQGLEGQVTAKLTPEICINNAASNSRLTAAGSKPQPQTVIHRTVSRLFFFSFHSPSFDETTTELHLHAEKLTEIVLHLNLEHFVEFCCLFVLCGFGLFYFSPLMRQLQNNI